MNENRGSQVLFTCNLLIGFIFLLWPGSRSLGLARGQYRWIWYVMLQQVHLQRHSQLFCFRVIFWNILLNAGTTTFTQSRLLNSNNTKQMYVIQQAKKNTGTRLPRWKKNWNQPMMKKILTRRNKYATSLIINVNEKNPNQKKKGSQMFMLAKFQN